MPVGDRGTALLVGRGSCHRGLQGKGQGLAGWHRFSLHVMPGGLCAEVRKARPPPLPTAWTTLGPSLLPPAAPERPPPVVIHLCVARLGVRVLVIHIKTGRRVLGRTEVRRAFPTPTPTPPPTSRPGKPHSAQCRGKPHSACWSCLATPDTAAAPPLGTGGGSHSAHSESGRLAFCVVEFRAQGSQGTRGLLPLPHAPHTPCPRRTPRGRAEGLAWHTCCLRCPPYSHNWLLDPGGSSRCHRPRWRPRCRGR